MRHVVKSGAVIVILIVLAHDALAQWSNDPATNTTISAAANGQFSAQLISDGSGGAIIAWTDGRNGTNDVYVQRINSSGVVQWTADGVAICTAVNGQFSPQLIGDGAGGAVIVWPDNRGGAGNDIYAQRINSSGVVQWAADGVVICAAVDDQTSPRLISDGAGGAMITWRDQRSGNYDIYAQRINASGVVQWAADGVAICSAVNQQSAPQIVSDGSTGAIITWRDKRSGNNDIYAQRTNASGVVQWAADGVVICTAANDQSEPQLASDSSGGAIVVWQDKRSGAATKYDIYAQRVDGSGAVQWAANGVALCTSANDQTVPQIVGDGANGAIIVWQDFRGGANNDIYAQRIDGSGAVQWAANGVALCTSANDQTVPQIVGDGANGAIVAWQDFRGGANSDIYAQKINASGVVQWTADGVAGGTAANIQAYPQLKSDGSGGAYIAWEDGRGGTNDLYAQRILSNGSLPINDGTGADIDYQPSLTTIRANWTDYATEDHYRILIDDDPAFGSPLVDTDTLVAGTTTYTSGALTLVSGTTYYVRIEAHDAGHTTLATADSDGVTISPVSVNDGTGADINYQSSLTTISANWTDYAIEAHYRILIDDDPAFGSPLVDDDTLAAGTTTYAKNALSLTVGTTYYVRIEAHDAGHTALATADSDGVTISSISVNDGAGADIDYQLSTTTVKANWTDYPVEDHYRIVIDDDPVFGSPLVDDDTISAGTTAYTSGALSLVAGTRYYVRIEAHDASHAVLASADSDGVIVSPFVVYDGDGSDIDEQFSLTIIGANWTDYPVKDHYRILIDDDPAFGSPLLDDDTISDGTTTYTNNSLPLVTDVTYYIRIEAHDAGHAVLASADSDGVTLRRAGQHKIGCYITGANGGGSLAVMAALWSLLLAWALFKRKGNVGGSL